MTPLTSHTIVSRCCCGVQAPYVPSSLALGALALLGGLGAALYAVVQRRRDGDEASSGRADKSPNWL
jgi:hypothetical protein